MFSPRNLPRAMLSGKTLRAVKAAPTLRRGYNFASGQYADAFHVVRPAVDVVKLRSDTVAYLEKFDADLWHKDPIITLLNGQALSEAGSSAGTVDTVDAFNTVNGKQVLASPSAVDAVIKHCQELTAKAAQGGGTEQQRDLRGPIREIEKIFLSKHAAFLIGNQAMDFKKQDGVTEIEESIEANPVEQQMNDDLLADEASGVLAINRAPALVGAVSNFSNFLDLCRKTLRNLEAGVPVVVLSRSNTTQYVYRWVQLLQTELAAKGLDPGMLTFVSCDIEEQRRLMAALPGSPLFLTGSREVAAKIKGLLPATFASTGGPNTMVATHFTPAVKEATRMAAQIENSGQCTAMRHLVCPNVNEADMEAVFDSSASSSSTRIEAAVEALKAGDFDSLYGSCWGDSFTPAKGYSQHKSGLPMAYKINGGGGGHADAKSLLPQRGLEEHWRRVYLDVTPVTSKEQLESKEFLDELGDWLVHEQPITLAVNEKANSDTGKRAFSVGRGLFERTSQVVYSVGGTEGGEAQDPSALTCQARPQDGEVFGEFPPRKQLDHFTKFPVVVPSPTPGYHAAYTKTFLADLAKRHNSDSSSAGKNSGAAEGLIAAAAAEVAEGGGDADEIAVRQGFLVALHDFLKDACGGPDGGPREGIGQRTTLWGLQRSPIEHGDTVLRLGANFNGSLAEAAAYVLPFAATNAKGQLVISAHPSQEKLAAALQAAASSSQLQLQVEDDSSFTSRSGENQVWNVVELGKESSTSASALSDTDKLPLVGHFISLLFPLGHIKSTRENDAEFLTAFKASPKWLRME